MLYLPDSHNSRSFLSRLLAPHGWPANFWALIFLGFAIATIRLAILWVEIERRSDTSLVVVKAHVASLVVTERSGFARPTPRSVLAKPAEGKVFFRLIEPYDRVLEPAPSIDDEVSFGYYPGDCDVHTSADVAQEFRLVCRPRHVQVGDRVLLDAARTRGDSRAEFLWTAATLAAVLAIGLYAVVSKRRV